MNVGKARKSYYGSTVFCSDLTTVSIGGELRGPATQQRGAASNPARGSVRTFAGGGGGLATGMGRFSWKR